MLLTCTICESVPGFQREENETETGGRSGNSLPQSFQSHFLSLGVPGNRTCSSIAAAATPERAAARKTRRPKRAMDGDQHKGYRRGREQSQRTIPTSPKGAMTEAMAWKPPAIPGHPAAGEGAVPGSMAVNGYAAADGRRRALAAHTALPGAPLQCCAPHSLNTTTPLTSICPSFLSAFTLCPPFFCTRLSRPLLQALSSDSANHATERILLLCNPRRICRNLHGAARAARSWSSCWDAVYCYT